MAATREEKTVCLMFSYYAYTTEVKLNIDWLIGILSKTVCDINGIASLMTLHWVNNFWPCKNHLCLLAKKVGFVTKNVLLGVLESQFGEIWRNRESSKLRLLLAKNED